MESDLIYCGLVFTGKGRDQFVSFPHLLELYPKHMTLEMCSQSILSILKSKRDVTYIIIFPKKVWHFTDNQESGVSNDFLCSEGP